MEPQQKYQYPPPPPPVDPQYPVAYPASAAQPGTPPYPAIQPYSTMGSEQYPPPAYGEPPPEGHVAVNMNPQMAFILGLNGGESEEARKEREKRERRIRMAFVRKVYAILIAQLAFTAAICAGFLQIQSLKAYAGSHVWLFVISWVLMFISLFFLIWKRKRYPINIILLILFTLLMGISVGFIVSYYNSRVVLQAFTVTGLTFVSLSIFTVQSRIKFDGLGPYLFGGLMVLVWAGILQLFLPYYTYYHVLITIFSALLFTLYIVYDTYQIWTRLSPEEYIIGAIDLYLDIVNVFLSLLTLLGMGNK